MIEHFEQLWETVEQQMIACSKDKTDDDIKDYLHVAVDKMFACDNKPEAFGFVIGLLCLMSARWNVNVFTALEEQHKEMLIDELG